jgi:hypothetical protein
MAIVDLTAALTLNAGKLQRVGDPSLNQTPVDDLTLLEQVLEEFDTISRFVRANEPGVLRYELTRGVPEKNGGADIVIIREVLVLPSVSRPR